nr:uncharacterized protein LOC114924707 [Arachis hypogaea]
MVCRLFKAKLDLLIKDIQKNIIFGTSRTVIYTIEFQKRGLPHSHILLFLAQEHKFTGFEDIDNIISAEIPDLNLDPKYYQEVKALIMPGPCRVTNKISPCMENGVCIRDFPKKFVEFTTIDQNGYPIYRRRDAGHTFEVLDEVKMYYDCRYISPCKSAQRIFAFDIYYRRPSVERLNFHLPDEQPVIFEDQDNFQRTIEKATIKDSMFIAWFQTKAEYEAGELYYLRMLLNIVKGPRSYEELWSFNGVIYPTIRDACYVHGLLDDNQEYIDAIEKASHWGSGYYLRKLFATLLWSNSMTRPEVVWQKCWTLLSDGILHNHIAMFNLPDDELLDLTLIEIEQILNSNGKTLREYATMLFPNMDNIHRKTFVWNTVSAVLRSNGQIVLTVASSGSLLISGGQTTHSRFKISVTPDEYSTCNIK